MESEKIIKLPKVELHCHLDGSLPMGIIRELLGRDVKKEELQVRDDCRNLAEYLEKFDLPLSCMPVSYTHLDVYKRQAMRRN